MGQTADEVGLQAGQQRTGFLLSRKSYKKLWRAILTLDRRQSHAGLNFWSGAETFKKRRESGDEPLKNESATLLGS
jgi:hypothetical protein